MHEAGIASAALEIALDAAEREGAGRITRICLQVGRLSGVVPEALSFAFEVISHGTIAEGAVLDCEEVPIRCRCPHGCPDFVADEAICRCPVCGEISGQLVSGRELQVVAIDVEVAPSAVGRRS